MNWLFPIHNPLIAFFVIVRMYMTRDVKVVSPSTPMSAAILEMMRQKVRRLVVTDSNERVIGIVCERDIASHFPSEVNPFSVAGVDALEEDCPVSALIGHRVITIGQDEPIEAAARIMSSNHIGGLPVLRDGKLVGIITESDIFRALTSFLSGKEGMVRVTFDMQEHEQVLSFLTESVKKYEVSLLSFLRYQFAGRTFGVANIEGRSKKKIESFIEELWDTGHRVENVLVF